METQNKLLQLISGREPLLLPPLDGQRFIQDASDLFRKIDLGYILGLTRVGVPTKEQEVKIYELGKDATLMEIFSYLSCDWGQKWLSQNQVIEFFEQLSSWLPEFKLAKVFFLCKKDETKQISRYEWDFIPPVLFDNFSVVGIYNWDDVLNVEVYNLSDIRIFLKRHGHLVVIPKY